MISACIPGYEAVEGSSSTVGSNRPHHVYVVHVTVNGMSQKLQKRYSAFHKLHNLFRKQYLIKCEFPPKRLRNTSSKVLESRRAGLERWLQEAITFDPIPVQLLEFLQIPHSDHSSLCEENSLGASLQPCEISVLSFTNDPYVHSHFPNGKQTVVEVGVLAALYDKSLQLPV